MNISIVKAWRMSAEIKEQTKKLLVKWSVYISWIFSSVSTTAVGNKCFKFSLTYSDNFSLNNFKSI